MSLALAAAGGAANPKPNPNPNPNPDPNPNPNPNPNQVRPVRPVRPVRSMRATSPRGRPCASTRGSSVTSTGCPAGPRSSARPRSCTLRCARRPPQRLRPSLPSVRPARARASSGRPPASASLGQLADVFWLAGPTLTLTLTLTLYRPCSPLGALRTTTRALCTHLTNCTPPRSPSGSSGCWVAAGAPPARS